MDGNETEAYCLSSSRSIIHGVNGSINYNTDREFNISATGNISLLTNSEDPIREIAIGHSSSPYYVGKLGIYRDTPASKLSIDGTYDNASLTLRAAYRGFNIANSLSDVETFEDDGNLNYANIVITKNDEKIYLHTDEVVVGKKYGNFSPGKITNLAAPTEDTDAVNKKYVDNLIASGGGGGTVIINEGSNIITYKQSLNSDYTSFTPKGENPLKVKMSFNIRGNDTVYLLVNDIRHKLGDTIQGNHMFGEIELVGDIVKFNINGTNTGIDAIDNIDKINNYGLQFDSGIAGYVIIEEVYENNVVISNSSAVAEALEITTIQ